MNKLFTKIASLTLGLALASGAGAFIGANVEAKSVSAAEKVAYTLDGTKTGGTNGYATESDITQDGISWKVTGNTTLNPWRIGGNSLSGVDRPLYSTDPINKTITKIELTVGAASNITVNSLSLIVASDSAFNTVIDTKELTFKANSTITATPTTGKTWSNAYYKAIFNVTVSGTSNKFVAFNSAVFYEESSAELDKITLSKESVDGYIEGFAFNKAEFLKTGITVSAVYSDESSTDVTESVEVAATTLAAGNNDVSITYGGKGATLVVVAITQEEADAQAAADFDASVEEIDSTKDGLALINPINVAVTKYNSLTSGAKEKATKYDSLQTILASAGTNYVIFNNSLTTDAKSALTETPESWLVPNTVGISDYTYAYQGAYSALKLGNSSNPGSITITLSDSSFFFDSIRFGTTKLGSDTGKIAISGVEDEVTPTADGVDSDLFDVSDKKMNSFTISTTSKRAYINYVYFEVSKSEDVLDSDLTSTGTLSKTSYIEGEAFDPTGLTISASYNGGTSTKDVTSSVVWTPAKLTVSTTSVTGTYTEGDKSATIVVEGFTVNPYTVIDYGKVGADLTDFSGDYYFANLTSNKIWNPTNPSETYSSIDASADEGVISSTVDLDLGIVKLEKVEGGYTIKNHNGDYVGPATSGLSSGVVNASVREEEVVHTLSVGHDGIITMSAIYGTDKVVYLRFNTANNQLKARYYEDNTKVQGFTLFKANFTPTLTDIEQINLLLDALHLDDYTEELGYCKDEEHHYYQDAKSAYESLRPSAKSYFGSEDEYADARTRLSAWAAANGEKIDFSTGEFTNAGNQLVSVSSQSEMVSNTTAIITVTIIAVASISAIAVLLVIKRRKTY